MAADPFISAVLRALRSGSTGAVQGHSARRRTRFTQRLGGRVGAGQQNGSSVMDPTPRSACACIQQIGTLPLKPHNVGPRP